MRRSTRPPAWWMIMGLFTFLAVAVVPDGWFWKPMQYAAGVGFLVWCYRDKLREYWSRGDMQRPA